MSFAVPATGHHRWRRPALWSGALICGPRSVVDAPWRTLPDVLGGPAHSLRPPVALRCGLTTSLQGGILRRRRILGAVEPP